MNETGTMRVKSGLAEMLKGGVIMDVVNAEQAKIAEDAGAVAVMALERVPADIRRDGGVARMSDPAMIAEIQEAVTIPVMAKCRIGHFVEAQILQALEIDYIDESEVLTPADIAHHVDKWEFEIPFVCGATNLGEALRRIAEGAAMIRTKGEAGTGDVVNAVTHMRAVFGGIRRLGSLRGEELYAEAKELRAPYELVRWVAENGRLPVVTFTAGGIATPADAALCMQLGADGVFVGSGIFKSGDPALRAKAIVEATTHYRDAEILARVSAGLGEPMVGHLHRRARPRAAARNPRLVTPRRGSLRDLVRQPAPYRLSLARRHRPSRSDHVTVCYLARRSVRRDRHGCDVDVERLLPADALKPRWSSASALVYLGGFVVLVATSALLGILGDEHGDWALVGYSRSRAVLALVLALGLEQSGRAVAAGVLATARSRLLRGRSSARSRTRSGSSTPTLGDYQPATLAARAADDRRGARRAAALPGAAARAADRGQLWFAVVDLGSLGSWDGAGEVLSILVGLALIVPASPSTAAGREPYGFWLHVVGGLALGGGVLALVESDLGWAFVRPALARLRRRSRTSLARSSYAVLGTLGILATTTYFIADGFSLVGRVPAVRLRRDRARASTRGRLRSRSSPRGS